jgi:hypothetical protein
MWHPSARREGGGRCASSEVVAAPSKPRFIWRNHSRTRNDSRAIESRDAEL